MIEGPGTLQPESFSKVELPHYPLEGRTTEEIKKLLEPIIEILKNRGIEVVFAGSFVAALFPDLYKHANVQPGDVDLLVPFEHVGKVNEVLGDYLVSPMKADTPEEKRRSRVYSRAWAQLAIETEVNGTRGKYIIGDIVSDVHVRAMVDRPEDEESAVQDLMIAGVTPDGKPKDSSFEKGREVRLVKVGKFEVGALMLGITETVKHILIGKPEQKVKSMARATQELPKVELD